MMGISTIRAMAAEAAEVAAEEGKTPYVYWNAQGVDDEGPGFPFPFIGDYVPEGWELVERHFADASGIQEDDEPALSVRQLRDLVKRRIAETDGAVGWALTEVGQFQVYVGEFRRTS